jgi:hypothetical protein
VLEFARQTNITFYAKSTGALPEALIEATFSGVKMRVNVDWGQLQTRGGGYALKGLADRRRIKVLSVYCFQNNSPQPRRL